MKRFKIIFILLCIVIEICFGMRCLHPVHGMVGVAGVIATPVVGFFVMKMMAKVADVFENGIKN
jgi:hypothetical protein